MKDFILAIVAMIIIFALSAGFILYVDVVGYCQNQAKVNGTFDYDKTTIECLFPSNWHLYESPRE